jgi:hypothetical protein
MVWELCSTLLTEKSAKRRYQHGDVRLSQCRSTNFDGLKALIDRDGLDITTSRALKDHIMVNPEFVDDDTTICRQSSRLKTPRCTLTDGICPSNTSVQVKRLWTRCPLRPTRVYRHVHGIRRCAMRSGFHDHPSHGPTTEDLPTILQVRRKGSLWFTYVLDDLDANIQKLANVNNINTKRVGSISDIGSGCSKGTWDRVIRSQKEPRSV